MSRLTYWASLPTPGEAPRRREFSTVGRAHRMAQRWAEATGQAVQVGRVGQDWPLTTVKPLRRYPAANKRDRQTTGKALRCAYEGEIWLTKRRDEPFEPITGWMRQEIRRIQPFVSEAQDAVARHWATCLTHEPRGRRGNPVPVEELGRLFGRI